MPDKLTHDDWCALSKAFNSQRLHIDQYARINDFLKYQIAKTAPVERLHLKVGRGAACFKGSQTPPLSTTEDVSAVNCASCKRTVIYRTTLSKGEADANVR